MMKSRIRQYRLPLLILGGALTGLTLVFPQVGLLEWITLTPALAVLLDACRDKSVRLKNVYLYGFLTFLSYYIVTSHWFCYMYPLDFTGISKPAALGVVLLAWLGISAFQAATMAFAVPLAALVIRGKRVDGLPFLHPFVIAAVWTVFEWLQAHTGFAGVPWARLCLGQTAMSVMIQSSSLFGSYVITLALLVTNGLAAYILLYASKRKLAGIVAVSVFAANLATGIVCLNLPKDESRPIRVAAIQGNVSSRDKWAGESTLEHTKQVYRELSLEAAEQGADVIVWPETAFPYNIEAADDVRWFICELARECDGTLLVSAFTEGDNEKGLYNSVVAIDRNGNISQTEYHKINLVPFGEFVPWRDVIMRLFPPLANIGMLDDDLLFGESAEVFETEYGKISSMICFDSIYEDNALESVKAGAELLAVATNDSWFSDSAAVYMHNAQSQLRAVETGRYLVRAANTGVSSVISSTGEIMEILPPFEEGYVIEDVYLSSEATLYSRIGNLLVYLCFGFVAALLLCRPADMLLTEFSKRKRMKQ